MRKITTGVILICMLVGSSLLFAGGGPKVNGAKLYIKQSDLEKAIGVLKKEVENVSTKKGSGSLNEDAWYLLGYIYARQGEYEKMAEAFDKAVELKPKFKEKDKGVKISKDTGSEFRSYFGTEKILKIVWGNVFNEGVKYFNDALNAEQTQVDLTSIQVGVSGDMVKQTLGDPLTVHVTKLEGVTKEQWVYGTSSYVYLRNGSVDAVQFEEKNYSKKDGFFELAAAGFKAAGTIMPDSVLAFQNMASAYMNMNKYEESIEPLKMALKHNPKDSALKTMLAQVYSTIGKDSLAMPMLEQLWYGSGIAVHSGMTASKVTQILGEPKEKNITEVSGRKNEQWVYDNSTYVYVRDGIVTAVQYSIKKGEQVVRTEDVADYLARGYIRADNMEAAKNVYEKAVEVSPDNFNFRYNYGTILLENKEHDKAIEQLLKAGEIDPESADINYNLGAAYLNRGVATREALPEDSEDKSYIEDFKLALPYLEKSIKTNPDDSITWFTLGRIAGQLNKIALSGYAFAKGEPTESALDNNVFVGMQDSALKKNLGEPNQVNSLESEGFETVKEWVYKTRGGAKGKVAIPEPISVYVIGERVDALLIIK